MSVKLKAISRPVDDDIPDTQALLAYFARVSATANQGNHETGAKLIRSLIRRKEWSPLEMVSMTMEITTTRDIARQILRHRSFSFQEFSQRYAKVTDDPVFRGARLQHPTDRQMSVEADNPELQAIWSSYQQTVADVTRDLYEDALSRGVAKEVARAILPEGLTPSRLYMAGTLRSWLHYCLLRREPGTQAEHRAVADEAWSIIVREFPVLAATPEPTKEQA